MCQKGPLGSVRYLSFSSPLYFFSFKMRKLCVQLKTDELPQWLVGVAPTGMMLRWTLKSAIEDKVTPAAFGVNESSEHLELFR